MAALRIIRNQLPLALGYGLAAVAAVSLTRFSGGVATLWFATSILIAVLLRTNRSDWLPPLVACGAASFLATSLFGLGLESAGPFVIVNLTEAVVAALLLKRRISGTRPMESLAWFGRFIIAAGIVAPACAALLAAPWLTIAGLSSSPLIVMWEVFVGHSLGNLALTPLAMLVCSAEVRSRSWQRLARRPAETIGLMGAVTSVVVLVFAQTWLPLLFLPVLPIILVCFRIGREGAALAIALLAVIGGTLTACGLGPINILQGGPGFRALFLELYLAATVLTVLPVTADLAARKRLFRALAQSEERYRIVAAFSTDVILKLDLDGRIRFVSPSIRQLGYDDEQLIGRNCAFLIHPDDLPLAAEAHLSTLRMEGEVNRFEYRVIAADGGSHWFESNARMVIDADGRFDGMVSIARNIGDRKAIENRYRLAAETDSLTGLKNRRAFRERVAERGESGRTGDSLALLDIDHFKQVNDLFGHDSGDEVLRAFAQAAQALVRDGDLVARVGGEEFAVLFPDTPVAIAFEICERLRSALGATPIAAGGSLISITVSGGVAAIGEDGLEQALRCADAALYRAKRDGRDRLAFAA